MIASKNIVTVSENSQNALGITLLYLIVH